MTEHFIHHILFGLVDFLAFWVYAALIYGAGWLHDRWIKRK